MPHIEIAPSNLDVSPVSAVHYDAKSYEKFLVDGGFDAAYEWTPLQFPAARKAGCELARVGLVATLHESWNERTLLQAATSGLQDMKIAAAFPLLDKCYTQLDKMQSAAGEKLPIIIHPSGQHLGERATSRPRQTLAKGQFSEVWYQPTAEWAVNHGIAIDTTDTAAVAEQILGQQKKDGLDRIALDLHHLQSKREGSTFRDPTALALALASSGTLGEVQVAIRPDFGGQKTDLIAASDGFLAKTSTGEILTDLANALPTDQKLRVVSEIAADEVHKSGLKDLYGVHWIINNSIRQLFGQSGHGHLPMSLLVDVPPAVRRAPRKTMQPSPTF